MAVRDHLQQVTKQRVRIVTVDPANERRVEGVGKDGAVIQIAIYDVDNLFRWPKVGEFWTVRRENGPWFLDSKTQDIDAEQRIEDISAGDYLIDGTVGQTLYMGPKLEVRNGLTIPAGAGVGKVWTSDVNGNGSWEINASVLPGARIYRATDQTISHNTTTAIVFSIERFDTDSMWDIGTPDRLICNTAGRYAISGCINWDPASAGTRIITSLGVNGNFIDRDERVPAGASTFMTQSVSTIWQAVEGDYFTLQVYQNTGSSLDVNSSSAFSPELVATLVSQ